MELYNAQTREREDINDEEALHQALMSGTHSYKTGSQVPALSPSGEDGFIPAENVAEAIKAGYRIKTGIQNQAEAYADENDGLAGAIKTFGMQALDETAMGIPEMVADATQDPLEVAKREELKKRHDIANAAGGITGFGASLLYGGPLWKGAAKAGQKTTALLAEKIVQKSAGEVSKSAAKRIARGMLEKTAPKVAGGAVEGVIATSPIAITEAALGDPEAAAESILAGMGIGGIFGGIMGASGAMGARFKNMAKDTKVAREFREHVDDVLRTGSFENNKLRDKAYEHAFEVLDPKKHHIKKLSSTEVVEDEFGNAISVARTRDQRAIGKDLMEDGILEGMPNIDDVADRLSTRVAQYRDDIAEAFKKLDDTYPQAQVAVGDVADTIRQKVIPQLRKNKAITREVDRLEKELDILAEGGEMLSLTEANTLKSQYQKQIGDMALTESTSFKELLNEIPKELNRKIRSTIGEIDKSALDDLVRKQQKMGNLKAAEKIAIDRAQASTANNDFGLTSFITGVGGASVFDGGLSSIAAGIAAGGGREFLRRKGDLLLAKGYDRVGGLLFAENAMARTAKEIDRIPKILDRMAKGTKEVTERGRAASVPAIVRLFKEDSPKHMQPAAQAPSGGGSPMQMLPVPKLKPLKRLQDENGTLANNPQRLMDRLAELTEPFTASGAPMTGASLSARMAQAVQYINQIMPKPPRAKSPFAPAVEWEPSDHEMAAFNQKLDVIMDPFVTLDELEAGTLTRNHVEALKTIYPVIFAAMQRKVLETVTNGVEPVPYADRVKLSMLMQTPMDPTMERKAIASYQAAFNAQGEIMGAADPNQTATSANIDLAQSAQTQGQRLLGG